MLFVLPVQHLRFGMSWSRHQPIGGRQVDYRQAGALKADDYFCVNAPKGSKHGEGTPFYVTRGHRDAVVEANRVLQVHSKNSEPVRQRAQDGFDTVIKQQLNTHLPKKEKSDKPDNLTDLASA